MVDGKGMAWMMVGHALSKGGHYDVSNEKVDAKGGIMMCKLKGWMDKGEHYDVEMKGWMEKVVL